MKMFAFCLLCALQVLSDSASAQHEKNSMVVATGSSILFPGTDKGFSNVQWEFSKPLQILPILDYNEGHQNIYDQYLNRVELNETDGSLLLKDVREWDTGKYKMTVDLDPSRTRVITLTVHDPLSQPTIFCNGSLEKPPLMLVCAVEKGRAYTVHWSRGEFTLPHNEHYWLSEDNRTLIIQSVQESDSGNYTCTVENPVSKGKNTCWLFFKSQQSRTRLGLILAGVLCLTVVVLITVLVRLRKFREK
ncbi:hepatocyte cell adhesion molecule-like isoform X2 [Chiloscyllium plagiosum]|uniref:hepatocyte cell adhesion molecule-like isoform X2 n=1 Tax=Chiloscyllium plagiosum TaxID=36176 RepID=UPI001CB7E811|nr:hepatocyte cell adhesion molecule-like isoform X2 [Chiloscyllium plagiosum]